MKFSIGPGALVAAAFIGPGTVTACTLAGANFGYALVWALVFATLATIILQDMAARLGAGAQLGLGEALLRQTSSGPLRIALAGLVLAAIVVGTAAYEAGNLSGGALGAEAILGDGAPDLRLIVLILAMLAGFALWTGRYAVLEKLLIGLVLIMSLAFIAAAFSVQIDPAALLSGLRPQTPEGSTLTAIALIGTTVVPYNLFLHAAASRKRWTASDSTGEARRNSVVSVGLGGLVSILILATAASAIFGSGLAVSSAVDVARGIEPVFGSFAKYMIGAGLLAAGLTSAITAPMATGYVVSELFPSSDEQRSRRVFRSAALGVLLIGTVVACLSLRPVSLILIAQAANGLLLPIIAAFLIMVMNRKSLLGPHTNGWASNLAGGVVVLFTVGLGLRGILRAFGVWP